MSFFRDVDRTWRKLKRLGICGVRGMCCGSCSAYAADYRIRDDPSLRGYAYYHEQDRDMLSDGLYIGFGHRDKTDAGALEIAAVIKELFEKDGFEVSWSGTAGQRMAIMNATLREWLDS